MVSLLSCIILAISEAFSLLIGSTLDMESVEIIFIALSELATIMFFPSGVEERTVYSDEPYFVSGELLEAVRTIIVSPADIGSPQEVKSVSFSLYLWLNLGVFIGVKLELDTVLIPTPGTFTVAVFSSVLSDMRSTIPPNDLDI